MPPQLRCDRVFVYQLYEVGTWLGRCNLSIINMQSPVQGTHETHCVAPPKRLSTQRP